VWAGISSAALALNTADNAAHTTRTHRKMNMPLQLIWADSEVAEVLWGDGQLKLRFAAAHVRRGEASGDEALGYLPGLMLSCEGVVFTHPMPPPPGPVPDALGRLSEGRWLVDGAPLGIWPLGTPLHGALRLQLRFANGCELDISATQAHAECPPGAVFRPSLAC
jgi:hypothetical protein